MLTLAVSHQDETVARLSAELAERAIAIEHVSLTNRVTLLGDPGLDPAAIDVGFVFPGRLMEGGVLDALLDVPWVNDREAVLRSRNKAETLVRLDRAGLPVPETIMVSNPTEADAVTAAFDRFEGPIVLKPNSTTRGTGVLKVEDRDSLRGAMDYLDLLHDFPATGDRSHLLQEYLPEARDLRVMVVDGTYAGAVERTVPDGAASENRWKRNVHGGATAEAVSPSSAIRDLALEAASVLDVPFLGVDILATPDRSVVTETNARPTVDDPAKYVDGFVDDLAGLIESTAASSR